MSKKEKIDKTQNRETEVIAGALIGVAIIAVIQLLQLPNLDFPLTVSLYCFAVAIPSLSLLMLTILAEAPYQFWVETWYTRIAGYCGPIASLLGIGGLFWHFSYLALLLFMVLSLIGVYAWQHYRGELKAANSPKADG